MSRQDYYDRGDEPDYGGIEMKEYTDLVALAFDDMIQAGDLLAQSVFENPLGSDPNWTMEGWRERMMNRSVEYRRATTVYFTAVSNRKSRITEGEPL